MAGSGGFLDLAGSNTSRARPYMFRVVPARCAHALQVWIPAPPPRVIRVAYHVPILRPFAANFTLHRHKLFLLRKIDCSEALYCSRPAHIHKALAKTGSVSVWF